MGHGDVLMDLLFSGVSWFDEFEASNVDFHLRCDH